MNSVSMRVFCHWVTVSLIPVVEFIFLSATQFSAVIES